MASMDHRTCQWISKRAAYLLIRIIVHIFITECSKSILFLILTNKQTKFSHTVRRAAARQRLQRCEIYQNISVGSCTSAQPLHADSTCWSDIVIGLYHDTSDGLVISWWHWQVRTVWSHPISISVAVLWWTGGGEKADQCFCRHTFIYSHLYAHVAYTCSSSNPSP